MPQPPRLDYVRGFHGRFVGEYMQNSAPHFAVGEYWDSLAYNGQGVPEHVQNAHRQRIVDWINAAGGHATAFDVTTKGILHAVFQVPCVPRAFAPCAMHSVFLLCFCWSLGSGWRSC